MESQVQAKFLRVAKSPTKSMMKVIVNGQEQWADCDPKVKGFAGKTMQEGQDVVITASFANNRYYISRISPVGGAAPQTAPQTTAPQQQQTYQPPATQQTYQPPVTVQQPVGQVAPPKQYMNPRTPEEAERMTRLSTLSSVCTVLAAVPGQIDVNTLWDVVEAGYTRFLTKVKE